VLVVIIRVSEAKGAEEVVVGAKTAPVVKEEEGVVVLGKRRRGSSFKSHFSMDEGQELNIYKQVNKLRVTMKMQEDIDSKEKYDKLKKVLTMDFSLNQEEIVEMLRVESMRSGSVHLVDVKMLEHSDRKLLLARTNVGRVYLLNLSWSKSVYHLNPIVLGEAGIPSIEETFPTKEENMLTLPVLSMREYFTGMAIYEDSFNKVWILLGSSTEKVYLVSADKSTPVLVSSVSVPFKPTFIIRDVSHSRWMCAGSDGSIGRLSLSQTSQNTQLTFSCHTKLNSIECIGGMCSSPNGTFYLWQFGSLYRLDQSATHISSTKIYEEPKPIHDIITIGTSIWIFYKNCLITILSTSSGVYLPSRSAHLQGVSLAGVATSLNRCLLFTLTQNDLFEDAVGITIYRVKGEDADPTPPNLGTLSVQSESIELISSVLQTFKPQRGDYTDLIILLMTLNRLEIVKNLIESALLTEEKTKHSAEQQEVFIEQISHQSGIAVDELKTLLSSLILNFYNKISPSSNQPRLKSRILRHIVKQASQANPQLLKLLKSGGQIPSLSCPHCHNPTLDLDLPTLVAKCSTCQSMSPVTLASTGLTILPSPNLICEGCGIYHPSTHLLCQLCLSRLSTLPSIANN